MVVWGATFISMNEVTGRDVIDDAGGFSFGAVKAGVDFLQFRGDISSEDIKLVRDGNSTDLKIFILDEQGDATGDSILI